MKRRLVRNVGMAATGLLVLLGVLTAFPIVDQTDSAEATFVPSTTSITIATGQGTANVDITPVNASGTFAKSDSNTSPNNTTASFDVTTNNYTGYTLKLLGNDATGNLTNASYSDTLASITSAIDQSTFESGSSYTNKWGIRPDTVNSTSNTDYLPAPTTSSEILMDTTSTANPSTAKNYSINLGAKVDYTKAVGTYTNTYSLVAVGNAASFTITYDKGGISDTVTNLPGNTTGTTDGTYATLSSTVPQRTGYTFAGWCNGTLSGTTANPGTTCTGTLITDGKFDLNQTTSNTVALHATWTANKYTVTIKTATGISSVSLNGTSCTSTSGCTVSNLVYNNAYTLTASAAAGYTFSSWSGTSPGSLSGTSYTVKGATTLTPSATANKYKLTITFAGTGVSNVVVRSGSCSGTAMGTVSSSGGSVSNLVYNTAYYLCPSYSNGYELLSWAKTSSTGTLSSTTATQPTFTIGAGDGAVTITGQKIWFQNATSAKCGKTMYDNRGTATYKNVAYTTAKIGSLCYMTRNLDLPGNITIYNTDSNITASSYKLPASKLVVGSFSNDSTAYVYNSGSTNCVYPSQCYSYYSFVAATAGTNPSSGNATSDICPKGWRLPTQAELTTLKNTYTTDDTLTAAPFKGVHAGYYTDDGAFANGGISGFYWSSTAYNASTAYLLSFDSSYVGMFNNSRKKDGHSIRCVAKT